MLIAFFPIMTVVISILGMIAGVVLCFDAIRRLFESDTPRVKRRAERRRPAAVGTTPAGRRIGPSAV